MEKNRNLHPMKYITFLICLGTVFLYSCASEVEKAKETASAKPNIILIVADDLGYGDLSVNGATKIATPNIDSLAMNGMNFTNAHVVSSICSPSRYSILTGRYAWRTRLKYGVLKYYEKPLIADNQSTLGDLMKRNGYKTACVGKWHLGFDWPLNSTAPENADEVVFNSWENNLDRFIDFSKPVKNGPIDRGFNYFFGMAGSNNMQPYVYIENDSVTQSPSITQKAYDHYQPALRAPNWNIYTVNQDFTNKAVEVIDRHFEKEKTNPLFLYFPTSAIHRPCLPGLTKGESTAGLRGDIVQELDWTVAQIMASLRRNHALENTIVIFTSDNGPRPGDPTLWMENYAKGDYEDFHQAYYDEYDPEYINPNGNQIWKKGWYTYGHKAAGDMTGFKTDSWEGGLKVPFIIQWPNHIKPGSRNAQLICASDLFATLSDIVGDSSKDREGEDSYSFIKSIENPQVPTPRESVVLTGGASGAFIAIKDGWKFIEAAPKGRWPETYYPEGPNNYEPQLYNLNDDPEEQKNLYSIHPEKVRDLKKLIEKVKSGVPETDKTSNS